MLDYRMDYIVSTILELIDVLKIAKGKLAKKKAKEITSQGACFYCGPDGHWKRKCKAHLESKKNVAYDAPSSSSIYVIKAKFYFS